MVVGVFGFVITLGLFAYEIYGIKKCHALIDAGKRLERDLRSDGQFIHRPREVIRFINEPFAAGIIYPAVLAAWTFLGFVSKLHQCVWSIALVALLIFVAGFASSLFYQFDIHPFGDCAVVACRVITLQDKNGAPNVGQFWNTQVFVRKTEKCRCVAWQVVAWQVAKIRQP